MAASSSGKKPVLRKGTSSGNFKHRGGTKTNKTDKGKRGKVGVTREETETYVTNESDDRSPRATATALFELRQRLNQHRDALCYEAEAMEIRSLACGILRYFLVVSCRNEQSDRDKAVVNERSDPAPQSDSAAAAGAQKETSGSTSRVTEGAAISSAPDLPPLLLRAYSSYGTPQESTLDDSMRLQQTVAAALMQQVELGALYLSKCPAEMDCSNGIEPALAVEKEDACFRNDLTRIFGPSQRIALAMGRAVPTAVSDSIAALQESQLAMDSGVRSGPERGEPESQNDANNSKVSECPRAVEQEITPECDIYLDQSEPVKRIPFRKLSPVLEALEVEPVIFTHMISLASMMNVTKVMRREMTKLKSVRTLLSLFTQGSNRIRSLVGHMLLDILPI